MVIIMEWYHILLIIFSSIILFFFLILLFCFFKCFYAFNKNDSKIFIPEGKQYEKFRPLILKDIETADNMEHINYEIKSFDNLTLKARYYKYQEGAPIEIMFHGYKGNSRRDMSSGIKRAFACHRNALLIDQRASGNSEGRVITFGINESKDCLSWINFVIDTFGPDCKIILTGISMGAATVMNASNYDLPKNVVGVLADCGFDSAKNIIIKTIKEMKLPPKVFYPFVKLSAKIFGRFNQEDTSPIQAVKNAKVPIIFMHGTDDKMVPCQMSINLYENCNNTKKLVLIENAGHGIAYLVESEKYINELNDFYNEKTLNLN